MTAERREFQTEGNGAGRSSLRGKTSSVSDGSVGARALYLPFLAAFLSFFSFAVSLGLFFLSVRFLS